MEKQKIKVIVKADILIKAGNTLLISDLQSFKFVDDAHIESIVKRDEWIALESQTQEGYWATNWYAKIFYWREETDIEFDQRLKEEERVEAYRVRLKQSEEAQEKLTYLRLKEKYEGSGESKVS